MARWYLAACLAIGLTAPLGCLNLGVPVVQLQRVALDDVEATLDATHVELRLVVTLRIENPLSFPALLPGHAVSLGFAGEPPLAALSHDEPLRVLQPGANLLDYAFELDLGTQGPLAPHLGKEVDYAFEAALDLGAVGVASPVAFRHEDRVRFPLLPVVTPAGLGRIVLLGDVETLALGDMRGLMAPFHAVLFAPKIPLADGVLVDNPIALGIQTAASLSPATQQAWQDFQAGWEDFASAPAQVSFPGPGTTGLEMRVPVELHNPNAFPIHAPGARARARLGAAPVVALAALPEGIGAGPLTEAAREIGANQSVRLTLSASLDWSALGGFAALVDRSARTVDLDGELLLDLGYGPTRVALALEDLELLPCPLGAPECPPSP